MNTSRKMFVIIAFARGTRLEATKEARQLESLSLHDPLGGGGASHLLRATLSRVQVFLICRAHVYSATGELSIYMYVYMYICTLAPPERKPL